MPPKKSQKKKFKDHAKNHVEFLIIVGLFTAISAYGLVSFFMSTNDYINYKYASVLNSSDDDASVAANEGRIISEGVVAERISVDEVFTDINPGHRNALAIETLYYQGIVKGYDDGSFKPDSTITRAEFWALVTNAIDADFAGMTLGNCFSDVREEWYAVFVCYAKERSWIKGFEDGSYRPNQPVTKAEATKMILSAFGYEIPSTVKEDPFKDVAAGDWVAPYAVVAKEHGVVSDASFFSPIYHLYRADVAQMIYNVMVDQEML